MSEQELEELWSWLRSRDLAGLTAAELVSELGQVFPPPGEAPAVTAQAGLASAAGVAPEPENKPEGED